MNEGNFNTPNPNKPKDGVLKGNKKVLLGISTLLLLLVIGVSYAYIMFSAQQESTNVIGTSCVRISLEDLSSAITLDKAYPITDEEGYKTEPYTFKITNECDTPVNYNVNLNVLYDDSTLTPLTDIAVAFDSGDKKVLGSLASAIPTYVGKNDQDYAVEAKTLASGVLNGRSSITHDVRLWLDYDASNESQNTKFLSKIVVDATLNNDVELKNVLVSYSNNTAYLTYRTLGVEADVSCKYGTEEGKYTMEGTNVTETSCELPNLIEDSKYYYEVCLTTNEGVKSCDRGLVTTDTPKLEIIKTTSNKTNITINYLKSGINLTTTCMYSDTEGQYTKSASSVTDDTCELTGLQQGNTYYYQICVKNPMGTTTCETGSKYITNLDAPALKVVNTNYSGGNVDLTTTNDYVYSSNANYACDDSKDCYIRADQNASINGNIISVCTGIDEPENCTNTSALTIQADTWYKFTGEINVTYLDSNNLNVSSIICEQGSCSEISEVTLAKVDKTAPNAEASIQDITTNSANIIVSGNDYESGIKDVIIKYGEQAGNYSEQEKSEYSGTVTIENDQYELSELKNNTTYYYEITVTNAVGNPKVITGSFKTNNLVSPEIIGVNFDKGENTLAEDSEFAYRAIAHVSFTDETNHYIKVNDATDLNAISNTTCGSGEYPGVCHEDSASTIQNNVWYKVNESTDIEFKNETTIAATVKAVSFDGVNYSGIVSLDVPKIDRTEPNVIVDTPITSSNAIKIPLKIEDISGTKSVTCVYGKNTSYSNTATDVNSVQCNLTDLTNDTVYFYKIIVTDNAGNVREIAGTTGTGAISTPTIALTGYDAKNNILKTGDVFYKQEAVISYDTTNVSNPNRYVKSTITATSNVDAYACGNGTNPETCDVTATKELVAGYWYKVNSNVTITYTEDSNETGTLYAVTYDGTNYSTSGTANISKIDSTAPSVTLNTPVSTTTSLKIPISASDTVSGLDTVTCKYGTSEGSYTLTATSATMSECNLTGLNNNTEYFYQVTITDKIGNTTTKTGRASTGKMVDPNIKLTGYNSNNRVMTGESGYFYKETANVEFSSVGLTNVGYYIKTTRAAISNIDGYFCGGEVSPSTSCSSTPTKDFGAYYWYKVSGNAILEYSSNASSTATIYAVVYDGAKYSTTKSATISKIDQTNPTINLISTNITTKSIILNATAYDNDSGLASIECYYGENKNAMVSSEYSSGEATEPHNGCKMTNLKPDTTYYYSIIAVDKVGNVTTKEGSAKTVALETPTIKMTGYDANGIGMTSPVDGYYAKETAEIIFPNYSGSNSVRYYIKSDRNFKYTDVMGGILDCGTGTNPGTCTSFSGNPVAGHWYQVPTISKITFDEISSSQGTLYAVSYVDGYYSKTATATIAKIDNEKPEILDVNVTKTTSTITITANNIFDKLTDTSTLKCFYSTVSGMMTSSEAPINLGHYEDLEYGTCQIKNLKSNTTYYYQLQLKDKLGNMQTYNGSATTGAVYSPTIQLTGYNYYGNTITTAANGYFAKETAKITFRTQNLSNVGYYIKSTGTASINVAAYACGNGTNPGTCSGTSTTSLVAGYWYKVNNVNVTVTYSADSSSTQTIYATTWDGNTYLQTVSAAINRIDGDNPNVYIGSITTTTNSITIPVTASDKAGISSVSCYYSTSSNFTTTSEMSFVSTETATPNSSCKATGLKTNTTYYYRIIATDKLGHTTFKDGSAKTGTITQPSITLTGYNKSNSVITAQNSNFYKETAYVTFSSTSVSSPTYYIKSTRAATVNAGVYACGNSSNPGTCSSTSTTSISANYWYKVVSRSNITVTYESSATTTATLYATTYDGTNYSDFKSAAISKIDRTAPSLTVGTASATTNSISIPISTSDSGAGISSVTCKYGTSSGSYSNSATSSTTSCQISGLTNNTTYYYQITSTDKVGNTTTKTGSAKTLSGQSSISNLQVGDYVSYTPSVTSYTVTASQTGYSSSQTIYPKELTLWRVISKNSDGTISIVAANASSTTIYFNGSTGYKNLVGVLNVLAQQYGNSTYTSSTRHMGYNGQTLYLNPTSSEVANSSYDWGQSDTLYQNDTNLVTKAIGDLNTANNKSYWLASRYSEIYNSKFTPSYYIYYGRISGGTAKLFANNTNYQAGYSIRPIVNLKSGLTVSSSGFVSSECVQNCENRAGSASYPWKIN